MEAEIGAKYALKELLAVNHQLLRFLCNMTENNVDEIVERLGKRIVIPSHTSKWSRVEKIKFTVAILLVLIWCYAFILLFTLVMRMNREGALLLFVFSSIGIWFLYRDIKHLR